jgi:glutathione S-transferase
MSARYALYGIMPSGPSYKVALMLALSGEAFEYHHVALREGAQKKPEFLAINRFGQVPALTDLSNGRHLCQSSAILDYLADKTGKFGGATLDERLVAREWMFWAADRLSGPLYRQRSANLGFRSFDPVTMAMYKAEGEGALGVLSEALAHRPFLVGESVTIADIDIYGVVCYARDAGYDIANWPHIAAWVARIEALPGFAPAAALMSMPA